MTIKEGDFVQIKYSGDVDGRIFDTTDEEQAKEAGIHNASALYGPIAIRVGSRHVIVGLDDDLIGKEVGYEGDLDVAPEKAFGPHDAEKVESFPKNKFKEKPAKGMTVKVENLGEGTVVDMIGGRVIVDFNHPLAGKTLHYHYSIEGLVEGVEARVRGLIHLYAGRDLDISFEDGVLTVTLPPGIAYDRRWVLWRSRVVHEAFEYIPEIREIVLLERFQRPEPETKPSVD